MLELLTMMKQSLNKIVDRNEAAVIERFLDTMKNSVSHFRTASVSATGVTTWKGKSPFIRLMNICEVLKHMVGLESQKKNDIEQVKSLIRLEDIITCFLN